MNRGMDAEAGGAAELQTDVMRFMAIISLCLVAIFALVQSMPLMPTAPPVPETVSPQPIAAEQASEPVPEPETTRTVQTATARPVPQPPPMPATVAEPTATPKPVPEPAPAPARVTAESEVEGFTLRFETDSALTSLASSDEIGVYAIAPDKTQKMLAEYGRVRFSAASTPQQFHEMEQSTVPDSVLQAFRRTGSLPPSAVKWGVTLSPDMTQSLNRYLREQKGGDLVIHADGTLRLGN